MKWLLSILLLTALPALAQVPMMPPTNSSPVKVVSPKHAEHLASLGKAMVKAAVIPATAPVAQFLTLTWDYPTNLLGTVNFEVWHASTLTNAPLLLHYWSIPQNFSLLATTATTSFSISPGLPSDFFIVRAVDNETGAVSPWNAGPDYTYVLPAKLPPGVYIGPIPPK